MSQRPRESERKITLQHRWLLSCDSTHTCHPPTPICCSPPSRISLPCGGRAGSACVSWRCSVHGGALMKEEITGRPWLWPLASAPLAGICPFTKMGFHFCTFTTGSPLCALLTSHHCCSCDQMSEGTSSAFEIWLKSASTLSLEKELRALISESQLLDVSAQDAPASGVLFSLPQSIPSPLCSGLAVLLKIWGLFGLAHPIQHGLCH